MPPLLKLWLDEVLAFGWAYGPGGTALRGKDLWLVATTGGPEDSYRPDSYNRYFFDAFLPPYEQTAALCGMRFLPPLLLHGAHKASDAELARACRRVRAAAAPAIPTGPRSSRSTPCVAVRGAAERAPGRSRTSWNRAEPRMEHGAWLTGQPRLSRRRGDRRCRWHASRPRLDHRLPRRRHPDRALGLQLVTRPDEHARSFAEFGVVLMLFLVGLELEPQRLWSLRKPIFGWGSVQLFGSAAAARAAARWLRRRLAAGGGRRARPGDVVHGDRPRRPRRAQPDGDDLGRGRPQRRAAAGHRRDPDPGAGAAARRRQRGAARRRRRLARRGQGDRHDRRHHPRRPAAAAPGAALDRQAATRPRSSPPRRCCWSSPPRR